jgi:cyanophycin synthetase
MASIDIAAVPLYRFLNAFNRPWLFIILHHTLLTFIINLFAWLRLIRFSDDRSGACSDRSGVIWDEAIARGIPMQQVRVDGTPVEQYRAFIKNRWYYFTSLPIPLTANRQAYAWMDSKRLLKKHLLAEGIAVPRGDAVRTENAAVALFHTLEKPVIIKPESGSRGRHTSTHIHTEKEVRHAFCIAKQLCYSVVLEEHLRGSVYRATYVGGEIAGILRGDPPRVTGDGIHTIQQLLDTKNATRPEGIAAVTPTKMHEDCLARQGYTLSSVLPKNLTIDVLEKIGLSYGGDAIEEITITHPELLRILKKAGDSLKTPLVGFDFISEDITKDPQTVRWGIIEANSVPFINLHHFPRLGTPINVAAKVWDLWV